jgi:hypothetical protein
METEDRTIERCFEEFNPYLCNVVMNSLYGNNYLLEKPKFVAYLKDKYTKNAAFAEQCKENLLKSFHPSRIADSNVLRRIRDINLLYTLKFVHDPHLKIEGKVTGRALELVAESVLKWKLDNSGMDYQFVDWKGFDYLISDTTTNDWTVGIQCKSGFVGGYLRYEDELQRMKDFAKNFSKGKEFIMFCGFVPTPKKEEIKHAFENEGWKLFYFWTDVNSYRIDESFYEFIDAIDKIAKKTTRYVF